LVLSGKPGVIEEPGEDDGFVIGNDDGGGKEMVQSSGGRSFNSILVYL